MRLRRRIATLFTASLTLSTSAIALSTPTPTSALVQGVVDVAVDIEAKPKVVSPPGAYALYEVVASNAGILPISSSTVTVTLPVGSSYDGGTSSSACGGSGTTVTCTVGSLAAGGSERFDIVASTPAPAVLDPNGYTATATIEEHDPLLEPLEYKGNNTDTTTIKVEASSGAGVYALLRGGDQTTLTVGDGRIFRMEVPEEVPGVIVSIEPADGTGRTCNDPGSTPRLCDKGFLTTFVEDHPVFKATDENHPLVTSRTFGPYSPCQGLGDPSTCSEFFFTKSPAVSPNLERMQPCDAPGVADPAPCRNGAAYKLTPNGYLWVDVLMLSNDPLELPPLSLGR